MDENNIIGKLIGFDKTKLNLISQSILVQPIPLVVAKKLIVAGHYLHTVPGGTMLSFGVFFENSLLGALTLGAGPFQGYSLVWGAQRNDCITLTRFWLSELLPSNAESHTLGILLRSLRRYTSLKFLLAYSDPSAGHSGVIYQASNWLYTGLSTPMFHYDFGDGTSRHSRSTAHILGSHSLKYFSNLGLSVTPIPQKPKYRYIYFLNRHWISRLTVPVLPYPKKGEENGHC
jgi:hypothetical protein